MKRVYRGLAWLLCAALLAGCTAPVTQDSVPSSEPQLQTESTGTLPSEPDQTGTEDTQSTETEPEPTQTEPEPTQTEPEPTAPPDGNPDDVTCQGSYTVTDGRVQAAAEEVVASIGDYGLTNAELQIYYWLEVATYRAQNNPEAPEFSKDLDKQMCSLTGFETTWQQFFLQRALNTWHSMQCLLMQGQETPLELEEAYRPDPVQHRDYLSEELPALKYLYGYYNQYFAPNSQHQAYLDGLPAMLEQIASDNGFADVDAMVKDQAGSGADAQLLDQYAWRLNWNYMYYTQLSFDMSATAEEVESYYLEHAQTYAMEGVNQEGGRTVSLRQILLIPENAQVAADGTVTADDESWEACKKQAENLLYQWNVTVQKLNYKRLESAPEAEFGELAHAHSADAGTAANGGLLSDLSFGQLTEELNAWAFDETRAWGDTAILRTAYGWHIVFFSGSRELWYTEAEADVLGQKTLQLLRTAMEAHPMTVRYSKICLGRAEQSKLCLTRDTLLYPDIAHQRFPEAPLYLQRDYAGTYYGQYPVVTYGCGITSMAMLASYMTDEEWTVPELCAIYGKYCFKTGTDYTLYDDTPCELGFYGVRRSTEWEEVAAALENGAVVISLQRGPGYWTARGHYILLQNFTEDGMVVVRDSNILNYAKLENHMIDAHEVSSITRGGILYWIMEPKVTTSAACSRCGNPDGENVCDGILSYGYLCGRCGTATVRRDNFLWALENLA